MKTLNSDNEPWYTDCMPCQTIEAMVERKRKENYNYKYSVTE